MGYTRKYSIKGLFNWVAGFVPSNLNPKIWLVDGFDVHGGPQIFDNVTDLIEFYPGKMKKGQGATITDYPNSGVNTTYVLNTDPVLLLDNVAETSLVTPENWRDFWDEEAAVITSKNRISQYTTDYLGGLPPHPYTSTIGLNNESAWVGTLNKTLGHKWMRFRDDDSFTMYSNPMGGDDIKVFDNWTVPLPIGNVFVPGDYIENRFRREDVNETPVTDPVNLVADKFYQVTAGEVTATRTSDGATFKFAIGGLFQVLATHTYVFEVNTSCVQVVDIPGRTDSSGNPNNEPSGWTDSIPSVPAGEQLWKIYAQKSKYGQLKSEWLLEKIIENPDYVRYSDKAAPHPDTLVPTTKNIADIYSGANPLYLGLTYDAILTLEGWKPVYLEGETDFLASRSDASQGVPGQPFSTWLVEKIGEESGEFTSYVFKLFPLNADYDDTVVAGKPVGRDPSDEGWLDTPQTETTTLINYVSQSRKFNDGSLKTVWSDPVPYTGQDVYVDTVNLPDGLSFKFDPNNLSAPTTPVPVELRLVAELHRGISSLWQDPDIVIAFKFEKIFDNGAAITPIEITSNSMAADAYLKLKTGVTKAGTITTTGVSVAGSGTAFDTDFIIGDWIKSAGQLRQIDTITSSILMTVSVAYSPDLVAETYVKNYMTDVEEAAGYLDNQILVIKHAYIIGKAFFKVTQTITTTEGDIPFVENVDITDITDGVDSKALEISPDYRSVIIWDTAEFQFAPSQIIMSGLFANLPSVSKFYWYLWNTGTLAWDYINPASEPAGYEIAGAKDFQLKVSLEEPTADLAGTVSSTGTALTGSGGTAFTTDFNNGDFIRANGETRKITTVTDDTNIVLANAFTPDLSADSYKHVAHNTFTPDQTVEEFRYAISTHATDPDAADGDTDLTDYITLSKSSSAGIGANGENAYSPIISNEAYTMVIDANTGNAFAGEIGTGGNGQTDIAVFKGETQLDYTAGEFTVAEVSSEDPDVTFVARISPTESKNANVYCDKFETVGFTIRSAKALLDIVVVADSVTIPKEFALGTTVDAPGAILLDVESDNGFQFDRLPGGTTNKTFTARLYDVVNQVQTELDKNDFYYRWYQGGSPLTGWVNAGNVSPQIARSTVLLNADIEIRVSEDASGSPLLRTKTFRITDIVDAKVYRLYSTQVSEPSKPNDATDPTATQGVWTSDATGAIWASDGSEKPATDPVTYEFSDPYTVGGEKGDMGPNGGFILMMYKNAAALPSDPAGWNTSSLAQMEAASWVYEPPAAVLGQFLYTTQRAFSAFQVDQTTPVSFDGNGKPDTAEMSGSIWTPIRQQSGFDGSNGNYFEFRYRKNNSATTPPSITETVRSPANWTTAQPTRVAGEFIWVSKALIDGDDPNELAPGAEWDTPPSLYTGDKGDPGIQGIQGNTGSTGAAGADGVDLQAIDPESETIFLSDGDALNSSAVFTNSSSRKRMVIAHYSGVIHTSSAGEHTSNFHLDRSIDGGSFGQVDGHTVFKDNGANFGESISLSTFFVISTGQTVQFRARSTTSGATARQQVLKVCMN